MLFFAHAGITLGFAKASQMLTGANHTDKDGLRLQEALPSGSRRLDRIRAKMGQVDFRIVLVGSLLPDIIDKPLWMFTNLNWDGRGYAHTFLLNFILLLGGLLLLKRSGKIWLLTLSLCSFVHLGLDQMWLNPTTLWWPVLAAHSARRDQRLVFSMWQGLLSSPSVYISEAIGFAVVLAVTLATIRNGRLMRFLKTGAV